MSSTQRAMTQAEKLKERNSTQHLEKILLSSSSSSSQRKLGGNDMNKIILTTQDMNSNGGATQRTVSNHMFNNTGKNWRKLITPAQDSFKKFGQQQQDYSGYNGGGSVATQNEKPNLGLATTTSHNTSMSSSNMSMCVKQFTPSQNDVKQLKMTLRGGGSSLYSNNYNLQNTDGSQHQQSLLSFDDNSKTLKQSKFQMSKKLETIDDEEEKHTNNILQDNFGASTSQMKSLMKSMSNNNLDFYANMYNKYYDKAKDNSKISSKPPTASQFDKSENLFTLTSKSNTLFGISQFKSSVDSSKDKPSIMRASSLKDKSNKENQKHTMSINFKNSLYKKINPSNNNLDNSSSQIIHQDVGKILHDRSIQQKALQHYDLDTSEESEEQQPLAQIKQAIDIRQHIMQNKLAVLGHQAPRTKSQSRPRQGLQDSIEGAVFEDNNALSRRDLSARHDETVPSHSASPIDLQKERKNRFKRINQGNNLDFPLKHENDENSKNRKGQVYDSQNSLNLFHQLLSSGLNHQQPKQISQQNSVLSSNPDFHLNLQNNYNNGDTHVIFEQPTKEDALEETYKTLGIKGDNKIKEGADLRAEDLTTIIENGFTQLESSQMSNSNDILSTYKKFTQMARNQINNSENQNKKNFNSHQNSIINIKQYDQKPEIPKHNYMQSAQQNRQKHFIGQSNRNSNLKDQTAVLEQKSDFTFVLSNPTDFQCDCCNQNQNQNNSFVQQQQRPLFTAQNSDVKSQNTQKGGLGLKNKLQDLVASPIYSENGGPPGHQFVLNQQQPTQSCQTCQSKGVKNRRSNVQHRLSYNQVNHHSIKEESQDEDDEYYNQNLVDSNIADTEQQMAGNRVFNKVFDYNHQQQQQTENSSQQQIISGETSLENGQTNQQVLVNSDQELKKLQTAVSFSQEYMIRLLQDESVSPVLKSDLTKALQIISSIYQPSNHTLQSKMAYQQQNSVFLTNKHNHTISQQTLGQPSIASVVDFGNNMTISELHQIQQQQQRMYYHKQDQQNIIHEEVQSSQHDQSSQVLQDSNIMIEQQKISPIYPIRRKQQQQNVKQLKHNQLKSSLISSSCEDPRFNNIREDTILSYFEQEDEYDEDDEDHFEQRFTNFQGGNKTTLRQSEMQENRPFSKKSHFLKQSQGTGNTFRASEIKRSLRKTKNSLKKTKDMLQKEKYLNREQEDKIMKLQAQIEALNERWKMTEENIKARDQMLLLMQRINHNQSTNIVMPSQNSHSTQQNTSSFKMTQGQHSNSSFIRRDSSPVLLTQNLSSNGQFQTTFNGLQTTQNITSSNPINLDTSSNNPLLNINDRLTRQIEDNLHLFENLNQELNIKDQIIKENRSVIESKESEMERLKKQINDMSGNLKQLIEITQTTSSETELQKLKHSEEMDNIKKRSSIYQQKIKQIQSKFDQVKDQSTHNESSTHMQYSKYQRRPQTTQVLNCIQLVSPGSTQQNLNQQTQQLQNLNNSNNTSRVQDDEFSIGQIQQNNNRTPKNNNNISSNDCNTNDFLPTKLSNINANTQKSNKDESLIQSNVLHSLYQNFRDTNKQQTSFQKDEDSTMLKYSQDITQSLQRTARN